MLPPDLKVGVTLSMCLAAILSLLLRVVSG